MNVEVYLFGDFGGGYTQYIEDDSRTLFRSIVNRAKANSQLVIHRDDTLMYYVYVRRLDNSESSNKRYLGICYALNNRFIRNVEGLFSIFEGAITTIASRGHLLEYTNKGNIVASIGKLYNAKSEFAHISAYLKNELDSFLARNNDSLPPLDYSISTSETKFFKYGTPQDKIVEAISTFPFVYIFKDENFENAESRDIASKLSRLYKEIEKLQNTVIQRDKIILELKKQKNIYKWVISLLFIIFFGSIVFFIHNYNQNIAIGKLNVNVDNLNDSLKSTSKRLEDTTYVLLSTQKELAEANKTIVNLKAINKLKTDSLRKLEKDLINKEKLVEEKDKNIADLKAQLPQKYRTKYKEQYIYNKCGGKYSQSDCWCPLKGTEVIIYLKEDGYGLTHMGGWIPLKYLEKVN